MNVTSIRLGFSHSNIQHPSLLIVLQFKRETIYYPERALSSLDIRRVCLVSVHLFPRLLTKTCNSQVDWQKGDALDPDSYTHHLSDATAVVHTLGTLIEGAKYKEALKEGNLLGLISALTSALGSSNPLGTADGKRSYAVLNRDSAIRACEAYISTKPTFSLTKPRAFVHVSAEDIFRPWIPPGYIEMKREAELGINELVSGHPEMRAVHIRPS